MAPPLAETGHGLPVILSDGGKMRLDREMPEMPKVADLRKKSMTPAKWESWEARYRPGKR
jgi:hypothetical protein